MVFYLPEPKSREDKPALTDLPKDLLLDLEALVCSKITDHSIAWGGYSPTFSVVIKTEDQGEFFVKGTHPEHTAHGYKILKQEIHVYKTCPDLMHIAPPYIGYISYGDEDDWHLGVWRAIEGAHLKKSLNDSDIDLMFKRLGTFYKTLEPKVASLDLPNAAEANFVQDVTEGRTGWIKFKDNTDRITHFKRMFKDQEAGEEWINTHLDDFIAISTQSLSQECYKTLISFDMRLDNIVFDKNDTPHFIDWPDACLGPMVYDLVYLCLDISAESGQDPSEMIKRFSNITDISVSEKDIKIALAQISGFYALQAYREIPEKLPRLRWIQKAILWAAMKWAEDLNIASQIPEFKQ